VWVPANVCPVKGLRYPQGLDRTKFLGGGGGSHPEDEEGGMMMSSPHEMAARAAIAINKEFIDDLPPMLREDCDDRDVVAPFRNTEIALGKLPRGVEIQTGGRGEVSKLSEAEISACTSMSRAREKYCDTGW
jgi:hypothetical protein